MYYILCKRVEEWYKNGIVDREFWQEAGKAGVIGIETPAELGGWERVQIKINAPPIRC